MIEAKNTKFARFIFNPYLERLLTKNFNDFIVIGDFPKLDQSKSYLITPNHFSWWDGFFIDYLLRKVSSHQIKIMMLEEQLRKYWFFTYLGAFSIDQKKVKEISKSIEYSKKLLQSINNALVIYPQSEIQKLYTDKLELKKGIKSIIKNIETEVLPISFKIEYDENPKPTIFCKAGNLLTSQMIETDFGYFINEFTNNLNGLLAFNSKQDKYIKMKSLFNE